MNPNVRSLIIIAGAVLASACGGPEMYYYGDYSSTLYAFKKEPGAETKEAHLQSLHEILEKSEKEELRVPPGIYAELGYWLAQDGNTDEAVRYFQLEKQTYPESARLMNRMIEQAEG